MEPTARDPLLKKRIIYALADDEEYPEEIYLDVNLSIEERRNRQGALRFHAYDTRYRFTEILEALHLLVVDGLVTWRQVAGYHDCCGMTSRLFRLTETGHAFLENSVLPQVSSLFD